MIRHHRPDEEPDFDEHNWFDVEEKYGNGCCERCGLVGHRDDKCPHVNQLTLKRDVEGRPTRKRAPS